ncbi:TPA: hypothetical protein QCY66_004761 [Bacillus cereus]|nr:hypothetical protein [Bacillus cereus]
MAPTQVYWQVSHQNILRAIYWATKKLKYSIDRPGMNRRPQSEALDDKIMGDIATIAVLEYLASIGVISVAYDHYRSDNFQRPDPGWDIAIGLQAQQWAKTTSDLMSPSDLTTVSVKSSRLPKGQDVNQAIQTRDFKIFKFTDSIGKDLNTNIELQVYYPLETTQLGNLEVTPQDVEAIKNLSQFSQVECQIIHDKLNVTQRWGTCALVGYNDRENMVNQSSTLNSQSWSSFGKEMWCAPLRLGKEMSTLIDFNI